MRKIYLWLLTFVFALAPVLAQSTPIEEKGRYERALEAKAEYVLEKILGPNQAKVSVVAVLDFNKTERINMEAGQAKKQAPRGRFLWEDEQVEENDDAQEILPGFSVKSPSNPMPTAGGSKEIEKMTVFPPQFVKKLVVSVVLNKEVSQAETENIREIVSNLLSVDLQRGDKLTILRANFVPAWKEMLHKPESINFLFKYLVIAIIGVLALVILGFAIMKLATAMNNMAKAQVHQVQMDFSKQGGQTEQIREITTQDGTPALSGPEGGAPGDPEVMLLEDQSDSANDATMLDVKPENVIHLLELVQNESAENIAIVALHLKRPIRKTFIDGLDESIKLDVLVNMSKIRFIESDFIVKLKSEFEERLRGAVGGMKEILDVLSNMDLAQKRDLLDKLSERAPELSRSARRSIMLPEDLVLFDETEISFLNSEIKLDTWVNAQWELPDEFMQKLQPVLTKNAWQMLEQAKKFRKPGPEQIYEALDKVMQAAFKIIKDGKAEHPSVKKQRKEEEQKALGVDAPPPAPPANPAPTA
ncbi:MAG: flagellar M-ring protein FliF C-terminal domain-containing protein [Elusimicrobiaceae bacterium]